MSDSKTATFRKVLPEKTRPFAARAEQMPDVNGFTLQEPILRTREDVEAFERKARRSKRVWMA